MTERIWQVLVVVIASVASALVGYWISTLPEKQNAIEYHISYDANYSFFLPDIEKLEVSYDGRVLEGLSLVTINLFNVSSRVINDVEIYLDIKGGVKPISGGLKYPEYYHESVFEFTEENYKLTAKYLNPSESGRDWNGVLKAVLVFDQDEPPVISVSSATPNLLLAEYERDKGWSIHDVLSWLSPFWYLIATVIIISFAFLPSELVTLIKRKVVSLSKS